MSAIESEPLQAGDVSEGAEAAVDAGQAALAAEDAAQGGGGEVAPAGAAGDGWKPPTREEFEALKQHAQVGQKYAPYANHIDQMLQQAFTQRQQPQQAAPAPKKGDEWVNPLDDPREYGNLWKNVGSDPALFRKVLRAEAEAVHKPVSERQAAFEERFQKLEGLARALEFHALQAPHRFAVNKDNEPFHKDALKALEEGKVNTIEEAYERVRDKAEIKRLMSELEKAKTPPSAPGEKPVPKKPTPNAASAAKPSAAPRGKGVAPAAAKFDPKKAKNWGKNAVEQWMAQSGAGIV